MVLHMLHSSRQLDICMALLSEQDTLLVMDFNIILAEPKRFEGLPCAISVLCEPGQTLSNLNAKSITAESISDTDWVELLCAHPRNMAWA